MIIHVLTDCYNPHQKDVNEFLEVPKREIKSYVKDISKMSSLNISLSGQKLTAVNRGKLLSLSIINSNISWSNILGGDFDELFL
jgi:D-alanyl-D-alanine dipeptidase